MKHHVGVDVWLELSSLCVLDTTRKAVREAKVASEPEALVAFLRGLDPDLAPTRSRETAHYLVQPLDLVGPERAGGDFDARLQPCPLDGALDDLEAVRSAARAQE